MPSFTQVFGGTTIYPSDTTYLNLSVSANVTLGWPTEQQVSGNDVVADIMDLTASAAGLSVTLPPADQASTGFTALFNNIGADTITIKDNAGGTIVSLVSGAAWQVYLTNNSTAAGTWRTFQYGASVSVTNAAALAGAGLKAILASLNEKMEVSSKTSNYVIVDSDRAKVVMWASGAGTFTLPNPSVVGADWFCVVKNAGSGDLVLSPTAGTIDDQSSKTVPAQGSCFVVTNGTNCYTVGFGSGSGGGSSFDYTAINVAGTGNYTLSGSELNRVSYKLTGVLTGNRTIIVPTAIQQYWIHNATTGAFTLTVKTAAGAGVTVDQGLSAILYCDGTDVVIAQSTGTTFPIAVADGGTGAINASAARTNLGATAVGDSLFTAASAAAAIAAIGAVPSTRLVSAGAGLSGGGDLSSDRTLSLSISVNSQSGNYTCVAGDANQSILHPSGAGAGDTFTIPANASVGYAVGTTLTFINLDSNTVSIAITSDTMTLAGTSTTGTRTLYGNGIATAVKVTSTSWLISGSGLV